MKAHNSVAAALYCTVAAGSSAKDSKVWTVLYESGSGDLFYADCRPRFRARYIQKIAPVGVD